MVCVGGGGPTAVTAAQCNFISWGGPTAAKCNCTAWLGGGPTAVTNFNNLLFFNKTEMYPAFSAYFLEVF